MKHCMFRINLFFILVFYFSAVHAQVGWYQVEVIVFEYLNPEPDNEIWPISPGLVNLNNSIELVQQMPATVQGTQPTNQLIPYLVMPDEKYRLKNAYRILQLSREYRPVYHISWQQPGSGSNRAGAVHIQAEDESRLFESTMPPELITEPMQDKFYKSIKLLFDGTIRIRSSAFLYVDIDLAYFKRPENTMVDSPWETADILSHASSAEYVRLRENRRIKLNELYYFDHPSFGVIIQVSRLKTG